MPALRAAGLPAAIAVSEYDEWPRGRVVYEVSARRFMLYADRRLHGWEIIKLLRTTFGLQDATVAVRADPHYR